MAEEQPQRDWEKEYNNAFTKKIPFPILKYECCKINPAIPNYTYTLTTTGIRKETKFELYVQNTTYNELTEIIDELKAEKEKDDKKKEEEDKLLKEAEDDKKEEEDKKKDDEEDSPPVNSYYSPPPPQPEVKETYDITEKALFMLAEKRIK